MSSEVLAFNPRFAAPGGCASGRQRVGEKVDTLKNGIPILRVTALLLIVVNGVLQRTRQPVINSRRGNLGLAFDARTLQ